MLLVNASSLTNTYECTCTYKNTYKHMHNTPQSQSVVFCVCFIGRENDKKPEENNLNHHFVFHCCKGFQNAYFVFHHTMVID